TWLIRIGWTESFQVLTKLITITCTPTDKAMSRFGRLFGKKDQLVPFDLSKLGCDIHSHLIPGIDDGSPSFEDSLELARGLVDLGYQKAITTPHVMSDFYRNSPETIQNGLAKLNQQIQIAKIPLLLEAA